MENMNEKIDFTKIPRACYFGCPYDIPMADRPYCWCKWYIDNWDNPIYLDLSKGEK